MTRAGDPGKRPALVWGLWLPSGALERRYWEEHHATATTRHDTAFFTVFLLMHMLPQFSIVPQHSQTLFSVGSMLLPLSVLLLLWRAPAAYRRHRGAFVFLTHLALTHTRAAVTGSMAAQAAVGLKHRRGAGESPEQFLFRVVMVSGMLFRTLEALGLQLPATQQAVIALVRAGRCPLRARAGPPPPLPTWETGV
ncbi:MAG: hypothetical protein J3K34DRAFT_162137 [Monoraphidium minutum]|nr:MAG: hypothetical protein J3K34DRAFT_162137 [Monoraphidium minutum]